MALNLPQRWWQIAWNVDPNDPSTPRRWTDVSTLVGKVRSIGRGRQYELAKSLAGEPPITFIDPNEYLNPANTSSPYYPNVQPFKEILGQCMWPPTGEPGSTGNLINADMWMPNDIPPLDPSFESYANGAAVPATLTAVGGVAATITTTNPQQGTKSTTYTVASTTPRQGLSWEVPCIPGQQYTTSAYVRQTTASSQLLLVGDQTLGYDPFLASSSNGWAAPPVGGTWGNTGGAAADYGITGAITGGFGWHDTTTTGVGRQTVLTGASGRDHNALMRVRCPAVTTGAMARAGHLIRRVDASNFYEVALDFNTDQTLTLRMARTLAGVSTVVLSGTLPIGYNAGDWIWLRAEVVGTTLRGKAWRDGTPEPAAWSLSAVDATVVAAGVTGCVTFRGGGNTNGTLRMSFAGCSVVGAVSSTSTTTTGAYVRLTNTFTASQPQHLVTLGTVGTAVAGTVNIDAIQHEPGGSANAFTTDGPCIFPILWDNVERWPRQDQEGMGGRAGLCVTRAVDGFAALNAITLDPDYVAAVMGLQPAYFWRLDSGAGTSTALETSGNQGPALASFDSKYGAGNPVEFGSPLDIAGARGGPGVKFTPVDNSTFNHADTILSLGRVVGSPQISFPRNGFASTWAASIVAWVRCTPSDPVGNMVVAAPFVIGGGLGGGNQVPVYLQVLSSGAASATVSGSSGAGSATGATALDDDAPHLLVGTVTQASGGNTVVRLYVDGTLVNTNTTSTATIGAFSSPCTVLNVGGIGISGGSVVNGVVAYVGLFERELSAGEVTGLWTAGGLGYEGELAGTRLSRRLTQGGYASATRISAGSTAMQPSTAGTTDALSDAQAITLAEDGTLWVAPDGALVMEGRQQRWLRPTPRGTFGENEAGGEIPYLGDSAEWDFDPSFVAANVRVSRVNGTTAIGGSTVDIAAAARKYFPRTYTENSDFQTDTQAQYKADWTFASHKAPLLRVSQLTIDPSSNTALWKKALGIEVGQRWTVKRRAKAANGGAGITQSEDFFIERVVHNEIDPDTGRWTITLLMSPIGLITNSPNVTFQPWILEHATYGVLDSTTVLGW